ncbi:hypothetical protein P280DRAFT_482356 [Massarina eburnea CBS 473.64]|uniref:Uncharacterized protein n=1 Tax=Massarina eburnea CBS 473.64 TaxID=1395130 RepID=A0A6A6RS81_9PLEO|nr:hypothetical protein P280DRAFT_482356 [Massarina eburnea CBS 473.64]
MRYHRLFSISIVIPAFALALGGLDLRPASSHSPPIEPTPASLGLEKQPSSLASDNRKRDDAQEGPCGIVLFPVIKQGFEPEIGSLFGGECGVRKSSTRTNPTPGIEPIAKEMRSLHLVPDLERASFQTRSRPGISVIKNRNALRAGLIERTKIPRSAMRIEPVTLGLTTGSYIITRLRVTSEWSLGLR